MNRSTALQLCALVASFSVGGCVGSPDDSDASEQPDSSSEALMTWSSQSGMRFDLPSTVGQAPWAGLVRNGTPSPPELPHSLVTVTWAQLNPSKGVYDFSSIKNAIANAKAGGYGVVFRLKASTVEISGSGYASWAQVSFPAFVPKWVASASGMKFVDLEAADSTRTNKYICPNQVQTPYHDFVNAFGKALASTIADPAFLGLYVHGMSRSLGEEMALSSDGESAITNQCGLDPTTLTSTFSARIGWWANAFESNAKGTAKKLAWVGFPGWADSSAYKQALNDLLAYATNQAGIGARGGMIETEWDMVDTHRCDKLDSAGYLVNDVATCPYANRYFGDEGETLVSTFGGTAYDWHMIALRQLARGSRLLWTSDDVVALDPALADYFNRTAGRPPSQAPDAWSALRSYTWTDGSTCHEVKNIERWLHQRDDDGTTQRANLTAKSLNASWDCDLSSTPEDERTYDWDGRSVAGGAKLKFYVDSAFLGTGSVTDPRIDVAYRDNGTAFRITYCKDTGSSVAPAYSSIFTAGTSGGERTASIRLDNFRPTKCLGGKYDVYVVNTSGTTIANFVRLVR